MTGEETYVGLAIRAGTKRQRMLDKAHVAKEGK